MKHYGLAVDLADDAEGVVRYRCYHEAPWPEALQGLREVGVLQMRIFLLGTRLFMHMATTDDFDPARDLTRYVEQNPTAAEWDALMRSFQRPLAERGAGEWWAFMECIFDLDDHVPPAADG